MGYYESTTAPERGLLARVRLSDGGCFQQVDADVARGLIAKGWLAGGEVEGFPGFWRLKLGEVR